MNRADYLVRPENETICSRGVNVQIQLVHLRAKNVRPMCEGTSAYDSIW